MPLRLSQHALLTEAEAVRNSSGAEVCDHQSTQRIFGAGATGAWRTPPAACAPREGHLARFVSDLVEEALDLAPIYAAYEEERGFPPYDPRLMLKLLLYGYATGTPSSRKLEKRSYDDIACRFLCADQHPDYRSITGEV